jgi:hypothetical protein
MPKENMTPKERWLAVLNRQKPDRVPMDYWATPEASARLIKHLGLSSKSEKELVKDFAQPIFDNRMHPTAGFAALPMRMFSAASIVPSIMAAENITKSHSLHWRVTTLLKRSKPAMIGLIRIGGITLK